MRYLHKIIHYHYLRIKGFIIKYVYYYYYQYFIQFKDNMRNLILLHYLNLLLFNFTLITHNYIYYYIIINCFHLS